jgi:NAD(P)-dependent dehydrogenase (short-subunit alcohol dehydrogenase family)
MGQPAVLITGGTGYLAQHTMQALLQAECARVAYTFRSAALNCDAQAFQLDLSTASVEDIATILRDFLPDVVLHLAASSGLGACEKDPEAARAVNAVRDLSCTFKQWRTLSLYSDACIACLLSVHFLHFSCHTCNTCSLARCWMHCSW